MDTTTIVAVVVVAALVLLGIGIGSLASRRGDHVAESLGSESDLTVTRIGDWRTAGRAPEDVRARELRIVPLNGARVGAFEARWRGVQAHFVDEPRVAIHEADDLVGEVMQERGYPVADFEERASDLSVYHPQVVTNYRLAHNIYRASDQNNATNEEMRLAMQRYRALFDDLLQTAETRG